MPISIIYISIQSPPPKMKHSPYIPNQHRRLNQFLADLALHELDHTKKHLKDLLNKKKAKLREIYSLSSHQVIQPKMMPAKMSHGSFMVVPSMAIGEPFLDQKIKANILKPERFYSSQANVKAGSFVLPKKCSLIEDRIVVNAEFEDFSRVVDQQSGEVKHKKLMNLLSLHEQSRGKPNYTRMKKTLFQKFLPDKYNFYNNPLTLKKSTTFQSTNLKRSRSKHLKSQQESLIAEPRLELPSSVKQIRTIEVAEQMNVRSLRRSSIIEKFRLKTNTNQKTTRQKNINSLE